MKPSNVPPSTCVGLALILLAVLVSLSASGRSLGMVGDPSRVGASVAAIDDSPSAPARPLEVGVVLNDDRALLTQAGRLGARVARVEFDAGTSMDEVRAAVDLAARNHVRLQPLVGWSATEGPPDMTFTADWARAFGPSGTHWGGASSAYAITEIELGNENASIYKSGDPGDRDYLNRARQYGERALVAARAVYEANPSVGLLVELETADTGTTTWIDGVLQAGGPELVRLMRGPVMHAYGPDWDQELTATYAHLAERGVQKPIYLTEWGIATDDGDTLDDNNGYPRDLTYGDAAEVLAAALSEMKQRSNILRQVMIYQIRDQRPSGGDDREHYFGLTRFDGSDKGPLTATARSIFLAAPAERGATDWSSAPRPD